MCVEAIFFVILAWKSHAPITSDLNSDVQSVNPLARDSISDFDNAFLLNLGLSILPL